MSEAKKNREFISLEGKVAIITGGASGIGLASAKRLAEAGAYIALCDINESNGKEAVAEIHHLAGIAKMLFIALLGGLGIDLLPYLS